MIFYVLYVAESSINSTHYNISDEILQYVKLFKLSSVKLCFKKESSVIFICNLNIVENFYNETQLIVTHMHLKLIMNKILKDFHNELKQCIF